MRKSWHLDRRTVLRGLGVSVALPFLEGMSRAGAAAAMPRRFCVVQFPYGCGKPVVTDKSHADFETLHRENWAFMPTGTRTEYTFSKVLEPLEPFRDQITPLFGLFHADNANTTLHGASDAFLTGTGMGPKNLRNTVSADQLLAHHLGDATRYPSYVFGIDGGIGVAGASKTLSYAMNGDPVPAQENPRRIFEQLFRGGNREEAVAGLVREKSVLDKVLEESKSLAGRLGRQDQRRLDEYLQSVRHLEQRISRQLLWSDRPLPEVDQAKLRLDAEEPLEYLGVMFDLMILLMQTDMARYGTFQLGSQGNNGDYGPHEYWPKKLGFINNDWHNYSHTSSLSLSRWVRVLVEQHASFLRRMSEIKEPNGSLLDNTMVVFGSANDVGHSASNTPLVLAGGRNMKFRHGQLLDFAGDKHKPPLANVWLTILRQCGLDTRSFADSTGEISELLA